MGEVSIENWTHESFWFIIEAKTFIFTSRASSQNISFQKFPIDYLRCKE